MQKQHNYTKPQYIPKPKKVKSNTNRFQHNPKYQINIVLMQLKFYINHFNII